MSTSDTVRTGMDCYSDKYERGLFGTVGFVPSRQKTKKEKGKKKE